MRRRDRKRVMLVPIITHNHRVIRSSISREIDMPGSSKRRRMETPQLSSPDSPTHDPPKSTSLLDLPPELFNMVVDNLLPPTMHNRFGMLEFEEGFKKPAKQDRKNFTALSMTCRAARELCYGAYKPKVVNSGTMAQQIIQYLHRYTYGREEAGNLGTLAESLKGQVFSEIR